MSNEENRKKARISEEESIILKKAKKIRNDQLLRKKIAIIGYVFIFLLGVLLFRVIYIKVVKGPEYEKVAVQQQTSRLTDQSVSPLRGKILDRNGKTLAISNTIYTVVIDIRSMFDEGITAKDRELTIKTLSEVLEIDLATVQGYYAVDSNNRPIDDVQYRVIAKNVSYDDGQALLDSGAKGIYLEAGSDRVYPQKIYAASVVGFLRGDDASSYWGLEASYDEYLKGEAGRNFSSYTTEGDVAMNEILAKNGDTVVTTIDLEMQSFAEELCAKYGVLYNADHTSTIVMDPNTGEILTMAQFPTYDVNQPGDVETFNDPRFLPTYEASTDEDKADQIFEVWKNFNISSAYEPGSIYKPLVVAGALDEGIIAKDDVFYCDGGIQVADKYIPCWKDGGHGELSVSGVLANSCNVGMILIGQKMGRQVFYDYQQDFGFGEVTGVDLPNEASVSNIVYDLEGLNEVEVATGSMGQSFSATALQLITAFNATINGGYLLEPYVVSRVVNSNHEVVFSNERTVKRQVVSKSTSDFLRTSLRETITSGTGKKVNVEGYNIGGKSGTAQQGVRSLNEYALTFEAYFPVENPQYVVLSTVYKPRPYVDGESTAAIMTKELIEYIIQIKGIEPSNYEELQEANSSLVNKVKVPDFTGQSVENSTKALNNLGFAYEIIGDGDVVTRTMPNADSYIKKDGFIYLYVEVQGNDNLVLVPSVTGLTGTEAEKVLRDAGFEVVVVKKSATGAVIDESSTTEDVKSGIVKKQMPSDNISVPKGTYIRLEVE